MGEPTLVELARRAPRQPGELHGIPGMSPDQIQRYGAGILQAVEHGLRAQTRPRRAWTANPMTCATGTTTFTPGARNGRESAAWSRTSSCPERRSRDWRAARRATHEELASVVDFGPWRRQAYVRGDPHVARAYYGLTHGLTVPGCQGCQGCQSARGAKVQGCQSAGVRGCHGCHGATVQGWQSVAQTPDAELRAQLRKAPVAAAASASNAAAERMRRNAATNTR